MCWECFCCVLRPCCEGLCGFFLFSILRLRPCDRIPVSVGLRDAFIPPPQNISFLSRFDTSLLGLMENGDELKFNACPTAKRHIPLIYFYYFSNRLVANREEENKNLLLHLSPFFFLQPINLSRHDKQNNKQCRGSEEERRRAAAVARPQRASFTSLNIMVRGCGGGGWRVWSNKSKWE